MRNSSDGKSLSGIHDLIIFFWVNDQTNARAKRKIKSKKLDG